MDDMQAAAYLAGMIDGEGYVSVKRNRSVQVSNTERDLIGAVIGCCEQLGLRYRIGRIEPRPQLNKQGGWTVYMVGKETLEKIRVGVPMQSVRKRLALDNAIAAYRYKKRPPREWVEQKYVCEGLSLQELAEAWGVNHSASACGWLKVYGIPARATWEKNVQVEPPSEDTLKRLYVDERRPVDEIVAQLGARNPGMLYRWLRIYGIPLRTKTIEGVT